MTGSPLSRRGFLTKFYDLIVKLGPIATLVAILSTNYYNSRGYEIAKEGNRAWLYASDVALQVGDVSKLELVISNAGSRPARVLQYGGELYVSDDQSPDMAEYSGSTWQVDETIEKGKSLVFFFTLGSVTFTKDQRLLISISDLPAYLRESKQRMYFRGRLQYFDGILTDWYPYCKMVSGNGSWQSCPKMSSPIKQGH
jgi:hypothetical protein